MKNSNNENLTLDEIFVALCNLRLDTWSLLVKYVSLRFNFFKNGLEEKVEIVSVEQIVRKNQQRISQFPSENRHRGKKDRPRGTT